MAVSSRSYLRVRECQCNLGRFLAAVPQAQLGETSKMELPEMLPGAEVSLSAEVPAVTPLGRPDATVIVNLVSSEGLLRTASRSGSLWVAPWAYVGVLVVVIALVAGLVWVTRRRRALAAIDPFRA